jgi:hypothetical protein
MYSRRNISIKKETHLRNIRSQAIARKINEENQI